MTYSQFRFAVLICTLVSASGPIYAQQSTDAARTAVAAQTATSPTAQVAASVPAANTATAASTPADSPAASAAGTPAAPPTTPAASTDTAPTAPSAPSADTIKRARAAGYRPEVRKGVTRFCREDATLGTRFTTKKCVDEAGLNATLDTRVQQQIDLQKAASGCIGCNSK